MDDVRDIRKSFKTPYTNKIENIEDLFRHNDYDLNQAPRNLFVWFYNVKVIKT